MLAASILNLLIFIMKLLKLLKKRLPCDYDNIFETNLGFTVACGFSKKRTAIVFYRQNLVNFGN